MFATRLESAPRACAIGLAFVLALAAPLQSLAGSPDPAALATRAKATFGPLPTDAASDANPSTRARVNLGRNLYFDPRLSKSQTISCNSCHDLAQYGVDGEPTSPGHKGQRGGRNSPTVYNAALHLSQFWDGRAADVEEQAKGPVLNPIEMALPSAEQAERVMASVPAYERMFAQAFPGEENPITFDNMALAIAAFERRLVTPAPIDRFMNGRLDALTPAQVEGLQTFLDAGCIACHVGPLFGASMYQKVGLVNPYPTEDTGRFEVTGNEADKYFFKVPSLRNVAETGPYFHDGDVATLDEAVRLMGHHQLGAELTDAQVNQIVEFLGSLTGEIDPGYTGRPRLPASGPTTPKPDLS